MLHQLHTMVKAPFAALAKYYSHVLEREISIRQTLLLLNAQTAFFLCCAPGRRSIRTPRSLLRLVCLCSAEMQAGTLTRQPSHGAMPGKHSGHQNMRATRRMPSTSASTSSRVLYSANEARTVPNMPKRSISGWAQ